MSDDLHACIDLPLGSYFGLVELFARSLEREVGLELEFKVETVELDRVGYWHWRNDERSFKREGLLDTCGAWLASFPARDILCVGTWVARRDGPHPGWPFHLYLHHPDLVGRGLGVACGAQLSFDRSGYYSGRGGIAPNGARLDSGWVVSYLEMICQTLRPDGLHVMEEEETDFPLNYHFVFHRDPAAHLRDLERAVRQFRHGHPTRAWHQWDDAILGKKIDAMHWSGRWLGWRQELRARLDELTRDPLPWDDWKGRERELVEDALLACNDTIRFFEADGGAFGVAAEPPLVRYCEEFYLRLLERMKGVHS